MSALPLFSLRRSLLSSLPRSSLPKAYVHPSLPLPNPIAPIRGPRTLRLVVQEADPTIPHLRHERLVPPHDHAHRNRTLGRERPAAREARQVVEQMLNDALREERRVRLRRDCARERGELGGDLWEGRDGEPEDRGDALGRDVRDGRACAAEDCVRVRGLRGEVAAEAEDCGWFFVGEPADCMRVGMRAA